MEVTRTFDLLDRYQVLFQKEKALAIKRGGKWLFWSTDEYIENCYKVAYGLLEMGFKKGDKIVTISNNRPEWNFTDHGMSMCGIVQVPVYATLNADEYDYILGHSEAKMVIVSDKKLHATLLPICKKHKIDKALFSYDDIDGAQSWKHISDLGEKNSMKWKDELEKRKSSIKAKDFSSLLYTSGTTGRPKGVMLSHENLVKNAINASEKVFQLKPEEKYLSILPLCHVGGRMGNYQTQYSGTGVYYAESMGAFVKAMKEIGADGFDAVPRIMEKIYDNVVAKGAQLTGIKKKIFFWAVDLGFKYNVYDKNNWWYRKRHNFADRMIFSKWRDALGGNARLVGCGGASLQPRLERLFWAAGVKIINIYGLTETSPTITISSQEKGKIKLGSVGTLIDGVEMKIADDGEILCKGYNVMLGYYKDEVMTKAAFDEEGWFHTGDIGHLEDGKFLVVTDRKKEIFKLSNGKFVAPQLIEGFFKQSAMIDQLMVIGEHEKFASAVISPDFEVLNKWSEERNLTFSSKEELISKPEVLKLFSSEVSSINKQLNEHEKILKFKLIDDVWSPESGELSPTLKLKRKVIHQRYDELINSIYKQ